MINISGIENITNVFFNNGVLVVEKVGSISYDSKVESTSIYKEIKKIEFFDSNNSLIFTFDKKIKIKNFDEIFNTIIFDIQCYRNIKQNNNNEINLNIIKLDHLDLIKRIIN